MAMGPLAIVQNCYVVRTLEAACRHFHHLYGIGPFVGGVEFELGDHVYRGRPADPIRAKGVLVQSGELNIELLQPLSDGPSAIRDMFAPGEEGFHHAAVFVDDYETARDRFVSLGTPVASEFTTAFGARICYLDARASLGHMIELYPENAIIRGMYDQARRAAANWDGRDLIVPWI